MSFHNFDDVFEVETLGHIPSKTKLNEKESHSHKQQEIQPKEFSLAELADTQYIISASSNPVFKWEGPMNMPLPSGDRNRVRAKSNKTPILPQISGTGNNVLPSQKGEEMSAGGKQRRRSVTEAVEFATGKLPGKQDQFYSLGRQVPSREVATLRKDTLRLDQKLKTALSALRSHGFDGSNSVASPVPLNAEGAGSEFLGGGSSFLENPSSPDFLSEVTGHVGASAVTGRGGDISAIDPGVLIKYEGEAASLKIMIEEELKTTFTKLAAVVDAQHSLKLKSSGDQRSAILAAEAMSELNPAVWKDLITALACCRFEQKHLDVCVGELSEQVGVLAFEQGRLLAQMRVGYNESMNRGVSTVHRCLGLLEAAMDALGDAREHELDNNLRQARAVQETEARAEAELQLMRKKVEAKEKELETEKKRFVKELATKQSSLRALQSILGELQTDSASKELLDIRNRAAKAEQLLMEKDKELASLQSVREAASRSGVLERRLESANEEVRRLQEELKKRSEVLENMLEGAADSQFERVAEAATSSEKAVVKLATLDPSIDSHQVLPPTKPAPGTLICVRCSRSMNKVMACEDDVRKVSTLEHSRPCKAMVQLLGPIPRGLVLTPPLPPQAPSEDKVEFDIHATVPDQVDGGAAGPFTLNRLRRMLADGPPGHLFEAPVAILSYPDCRRFRPEILSKDPEEDEDDDEVLGEVYDAAVHLHFPNSQASVAAEKAFKFSAGQGMGAEYVRESQEQNLAVFHGASPWWVRLVMRAILWAKVEDEMVSGPSTKFCDFVWAWFDPTDGMREAYHSHRMELQSTLDPKTVPKKMSSISALSDLMELAEAKRWLFFDGLRQLAAEGDVVGVGEGPKKAESRTKTSDPEAALFWTLLDGRNGNDYERFLIHALECLEAAFPFHDARLRRLLGPAAYAANFAMLVSNTLEVEAAAGADAHHFTLSAHSLATAVAPPRIWLPLWAVMQATRVLLSRAPSGLRERVLGTLGGLAVAGKGRLAPRPMATDPNSQQEEAAAQESEEKEKAVDMFLWLKVIMRCYKEEQVNRDAAVRVMISSVEAGNKGKERANLVARQQATTDSTGGASDSSSRKGGEADPRAQNESMLTASQCVAVAKSLDSTCDAPLAVAVYRRAAEMGVVPPSADDMVGVPLRSVVVTPESWLCAAEEYGLLKSCLQLRGRIVSNRRAADIEGLSRASATQVGSFIHLRVQLIMPYLMSLMPRLPAPSSACFAAAVREVCKALQTPVPPIFGTDPSTKSRKKKRKMLVKKSKVEPSTQKNSDNVEDLGGGDGDLPPIPQAPKVFIALSIDGSAALVAYRRLLAMLGSLRREQNETGRVGVFPLTSTAWDKENLSALNNSKGRQVVQRIATELVTAELTVFPSGCVPLSEAHATAKAIVREANTNNHLELREDPRLKIKPLQRKVAASRLVLWWKRLLALKLLQGNLAPLKVAAFFGRPGMLAGRGGGLKARKMHWRARLIMSAIEHCIGGLCIALQCAKQPPCLAKVLHERGQVLLGVPTLAERFVVDLCFNVNNLQKWFPRCRMFGLLLGGMGSSSALACWAKDESEQREQTLKEASESADRRTREASLGALMHLGVQQRGDGVVGLATRALSCSRLEREIRDSSEEASTFYAQAVSVLSRCFHERELRTNTTRIIAASLTEDVCEDVLSTVMKLNQTKAAEQEQAEENRSSRKKRKARIDPDAAAKERELMAKNRQRIVEIEQKAKKALLQAPHELFPCTRQERITFWGKNAKGKSPHVIKGHVIEKCDGDEDSDEWRLSKTAVFGEAFLGQAERQRRFGGKWRNSYFAAGGRDSALSCLADLFLPRNTNPRVKSSKKPPSDAHRILIEKTHANRLYRYEQDVAAAKSNLKPDVRDRKTRTDRRKSSAVSPDPRNGVGSFEEQVPWAPEVYVVERRPLRVFGGAPAVERPTESRPLLEQQLCRRFHDLRWDEGTTNADDVLWAVMMVWAENRLSLKSWCARAALYARDHRKVCAPSLDSAVAVAALAYEEQLRQRQDDLVLTTAGLALGGKPYKRKSDGPSNSPAQAPRGRSQKETKPLDPAFALREFNFQSSLSSSKSSLWSEIEGVTHPSDTVGTLIQLRSPLSLGSLQLEDMVLQAALSRSTNTVIPQSSSSVVKLRYTNPRFTRDFFKMVWACNERPLEGHVANLIIDARRLAPNDKCGVPGFGNQSELPLDRYLVEKAACNDVINAPNSGESLKWCLEECRQVREVLRECSALELEDPDETSIAYQKKIMAMKKKKKQMDEEAEEEATRKGHNYLKHKSLTLDIALRAQQLREAKEQKLLSASQRVRALFANVNVAQDRVAVASMVGAQNFVRDGWAGGHKGSSRPDHFPPCE